MAGCVAAGAAEHVIDGTVDIGEHVQRLPERRLVQPAADARRRRVEIGDYLNPDAAGWAYNHADEIELVVADLEHGATTLFVSYGVTAGAIRFSSTSGCW